MKENNIVLKKSYDFALRIVTFSRYLSDDPKEYILSGQVLRSATSNGANLEETIGAQSKKDFNSKISISYKEIKDTLYWIRLPKDSPLISDTQAEELLSDCERLLKIMGSIQKPMKSQENS